MINILPPQTKQELNYARQNARLLRYLMLILLTEALLGGLLIFSLVYANRQANDYQANLASRQQQRSSYQEIEKKVEHLQSSLSTIDSLLNEKTKYSTLLRDLAAALPGNSYITQAQLTGDATKPMELLVNTDSFNRAAEVRNGLIQSERIKSADIHSVTRDKDSEQFLVVLIVSFEPGGAR